MIIKIYNIRTQIVWNNKFKKTELQSRTLTNNKKKNLKKIEKEV